MKKAIKTKKTIKFLLQSSRVTVTCWVTVSF
jgi:hypothetical protein